MSVEPPEGKTACSCSHPSNCYHVNFEQGQPAGVCYHCERLTRKRTISRLIFSFGTPGNSILVPGNSFFGDVMNVSMFASLQTMPDFRRSSEYSNPATEAAFRPTTPYRFNVPHAYRRIKGLE